MFYKIQLVFLCTWKTKIQFLKLVFGFVFLLKLLKNRKKVIKNIAKLGTEWPKLKFALDNFFEIDFCFCFLIKSWKKELKIVIQNILKIVDSKSEIEICRNLI